MFCISAISDYLLTIAITEDIQGNIYCIIAWATESKTFSGYFVLISAIILIDYKTIITVIIIFK